MGGEGTERYSSTQNYTDYPGDTMLDGVSRNPGPSIMQDAMPTANFVIQAQCQSPAPQAVTSASYTSMQPNSHRPIQVRLYSLDQDGSANFLKQIGMPPQHYRHFPNPRYPQQSSAYSNGVRQQAQQQAQFMNSGKFQTAACTESSNMENRQVPSWHRSYRQGYVAPANITTMGATTTKSSNGTFSHHNKQPIVLPNPSGFRSSPLQSNFKRFQQSSADATERSAPTPNGTNWSQPVQMSSSQLSKLRYQPIQFQQQQINHCLPPTTSIPNQLPTVQGGTIRFQPDLSHSVPSTTIDTNQFPKVQHQPVRILTELPQNVPTRVANNNQQPAPQNQQMQYGQQPTNNVTAGTNIQLPTMQNEAMQFQPSPSQNVPPATAAANPLPKPQNQPIPILPELNNSLSMKVSCQTRGGAVIARVNTVPHQTIVLQNCQIINSPTIVQQTPGGATTGLGIESTLMRMIELQRPDSIINSSNTNRRLAGNTLPGDMLMTTQVMGSLIRKSTDPKRSQPVRKDPPVCMNSKVISQSQPTAAADPRSQSNSIASTTNIIVAGQIVPNADKSNLPISQNHLLRLPAPFVQLTPPSKRLSSMPVSSQAPALGGLQSTMSSTTTITSMEHVPVSTISSSNSSSPVRNVIPEVAEKNVTATHHQLVGEHAEQSISSIEKGTANPQASVTESFLKRGNEQVSANSSNCDKRAESYNSENRNEEASYGYDYNTLAKAFQQSAKNSSSIGKPQVEERRKVHVKTEVQDILQPARQILPPASPRTNESDKEHAPNEFGYDYDSMVKARQKADQQKSKSKHINMLEKSVVADRNIEQRKEAQTTPSKSQNGDQPFGSPSNSSPSKFASRNNKRTIPPLSNSDTDEESEAQSIRHRRKRSKMSKIKKKWLRIIEPSDSSDTEDESDSTTKSRGHSPSSSKFHENSPIGAAHISTNIPKRKRYDISEEPSQKRSISQNEYTYMTNCQVVLRKLKEDSGLVRDKTVQNHSNYTVWPARSSHEYSSFRQLNHNVPYSASSPHSDKPVNSTLKTQFSNTSEQSWRDVQKYCSDSEESHQASIANISKSDSTDDADISSVCFGPSDNNRIENTLLHETDHGWWRNRKDSSDTDTTVTTESGTQWLPNQSCYLESDELNDFSNIEENESPYHSEADDCDDAGSPREKADSEKSMKKIKRVRFADDYLEEKKNTSTITSDKKIASTSILKASTGRHSEVDDKPLEQIENKELPSSDEDDDVTSSYTSSNSGSPVKFRHLDGDDEWPFSDENERIDEDEIDESRSSKKAYKQNHIGHQLNDLMKDRKSLVSIPEMRLTTNLKLRSRRTHISRERWKKKKYLKELGLFGTSAGLAHFEFLRLLANSSRPVEMKSKTLPPLEGCSRAKGSIDVMKHQNR